VITGQHELAETTSLAGTECRFNCSLQVKNGKKIQLQLLLWREALDGAPKSKVSRYSYEVQFATFQPPRKEPIEIR
jgi:hypothetical protein